MLITTAVKQVIVRLENELKIKESECDRLRTLIKDLLESYTFVTKKKSSSIKGSSIKGLNFVIHKKCQYTFGNTPCPNIATRSGLCCQTQSHKTQEWT